MKVEHDRRLPDLPYDDLSQQLARKMARWLFEVRCIPDIERFKESLCLPSDTKVFFNKAVNAYQEYLRYKLNQLKEKGRFPSCSPGCAHCCYFMPAGLSAFEIVALYEAMWHENILARTFRRFLEKQEIMNQLCDMKQEECVGEEFYSAEDQEQLHLLKYYYMREPCPFLGSGNRCLIYRSRPFVCRQYFSCSPPSWCDPEHVHFNQALKIAFPLPEEARDELDKIDGKFAIELPDTMCGALLVFAVNIACFRPIQWT